jgi:integrase
VKGRRYCVNLGVEIGGNIPASLRDFGDIIFERGRVRAQEKLEAIVREEEQLRRIFEITNGDEFTYPIIVTGICTAMRRGDCRLLKWGDVDLQNNFISVKTAKTGARTKIPIWPLLRDIFLKKQRSKETGDKH